MDETRVVRSRWAAWGVIGAIVVLVLVSIWLLPREDHRPGMGVRTTTDETTAVATTGADARGDRGLAMGREGITTSPIVRQLEMLTGVDDRHALVGQRVELEITREQAPHHVAFWVGDEPDRVLVVMARDTRDGAARQRGLGAVHAVNGVPGTTHLRIVGTVARIPHAEATFSWGLTRPEYAALLDRGFYIHAEEVVAYGEPGPGGWAEGTGREAGDRTRTAADPRTASPDDRPDRGQNGEPRTLDRGPTTQTPGTGTADEGGQGTRRDVAQSGTTQQDPTDARRGDGTGQGQGDTTRSPSP